MVEPNSIQERCSARCNASAGCSGLGCVSSRYSRITADSKIATSSTLSSGTLPSGEIARNQSGLLARSTLMRSNATPFSVSAIAARCTNGQSSWLMRVSFVMCASSGLGGGTQGGKGQRTRFERERAVADQGVHCRGDDQEHRIFPAAVSIAEDHAVREVDPGRHRHHRQQSERDEAAVETGEDENAAGQL